MITRAMQLNRFDLNLLIALDALLREKNVTRAAERVFVSQPAMSAALHKLREYFNDQLLVRVGREMELTPRGASLLEPVREALLRIQVMVGTQPVFDPKTARREFTVIMSEEAVPGVMPALLRALSHESPELDVHIEMISPTALSRLEYGEADLCLCLENLQMFDLRAYPESIRSMPLRPVTWVCAVSADHPTVKDSLTIEEYIPLRHMFGRPGGYTGSADQLVRHLLNIDLKVHMTLPSLLQLPLALPGSTLVATLPERVARLYLPELPIKILPLPFDVPPTQEVLLWHKRHEPDPAHTWLRELIVRIARESTEAPRV
jgi:LysR family transcriptional regulator, nod-box dependent transcriptional activator